MKKIVIAGIVLLLCLSMMACTGQKGELEVPDQGNDIAEVEKNDIEKYSKLIGLSKEEIIEVMAEEPNAVDEGGLEFSDYGIRVWFIEDGKTVDQIFMYDSDIDFNGARIGEPIEAFRNVFGETVLEDTSSAYSNFEYKELAVHVQYDPSTEKVVAVYLMKEWK